MNDRDRADLAASVGDANDFRTAGHELIELLATAIEQESTDPILEPTCGDQLRSMFDDPVPRDGMDPWQALATGRDLLVHHRRKNGHPRFFGYVCASADPIGALADLMASVLNQNVTAWRSAPSATAMERQVLRWIDELVGFDANGQGVLTSGGSAANTTAIAAAVVLAGRSGNSSRIPRDRITMYVSSEGHLSLIKAAGVLGIADDKVRRIPVDARRRLRPDALHEFIVRDVEGGFTPACICASAGTANSATIDPLDEVADVAERHGVWLHIDGAYGAPAAMTRQYAWMRRSFARADSVSIDPHKWLFAPLDVGCLLFRDAAAIRRVFTLQSEYIAVSQTDPIESHAFFDHGLELSRRARALKVWMILKVRGADRITSLIEHNIALREYLDQRVADHARLAPMGSDLSICCFQYRPVGGGDRCSVNDLNRRILDTLVRGGRVFMSPTTLDGDDCLRVCIVNFRTRREDIDILVDEVVRVGDLLAHTNGSNE